MKMTYKAVLSLLIILLLVTTISTPSPKPISASGEALLIKAPLTMDTGYGIASASFTDNAAPASYYLKPGATGTSLTVAGNVGIGTTGPSYKIQVVGTLYAGGSSREYKQNIIPLVLDPKRIYELNPVTYDYKPQYQELGKKLSGGRQFGLIAEDVYKIYPELTLSDGTRNVANVDYEKLAVLLLAEMKNQKKEIDSLKQQIKDLQQRLEFIESKLK